MKAIIMAGGEGARLRPLTCDRPKPLVPVVNKPVMEYAIELLRLYGIKDIGVTLQYLPEAIVDYFGDGSRWEVNLHYFVEDSPLGTAGSIKNAEEFLDETFVVVSGDALTDFNLAQAMDFHRRCQAMATLVLTSVPNPLEYGVVITDEAGRVVKFLEKPGWGEVFSDQVNTGIYVLQPEVLSLVPKGVMFDFSKDLFPELLKRKERLYATVLEGYWCDIGNLDQYMEAHRAVLEGRVKVAPPAVYQGNGLWIGQGVQIDKTAHLEGPVLLGDYCRIGPGVEIGPYTVLGHNVQVKDRASLKQSVVWDGSYIGPDSQLRGAVLCRQVTMEKAGSVFEGGVVGDQTRIERNAVVKPQVKIWPHKRLGAGVKQNSSLVWGSGSKKNLFGSHGIPGPFNREITPEVAAKLGAAYGSTIPVQKKIGISCDGQQGVPMLKSAFLAGLLSTGVHGVDLGIIPFSALRYAVDALGFEGGVHIATDLADPVKVWFRFVDEKGIIINRNKERKLENVFMREDFRRVGMEDMGLTYPLSNVEEIYSNYILERIDREKIREKGYHLVVSTAPGSSLSGMLSRLFNRSGIKHINVMNDPSEAKPFFSNQGVSRALQNLAEQVVQQQGALGAWLDPDGEKLYLVDDRGEIVDENLYLLLVASIIFRTNPGAKVAVPVTAPKAIESLAGQFGGEVVRTKTRVSQLMEVLARPELKAGQGDFSQLALQFDALHGLFKILDYLAAHNLKLSDLIGQLPTYYMDVQSTVCPWEAKGQIMRRLIEEYSGEEVELVDGIKIYKDQGWALVLPDADEPVYRVYSEGFTQEAASELATFYVERIQQLIQNQVKQPLS